MKLSVLITSLLLSFAASAHALDKAVVLKLVKEDIAQYEGRLLGVKYVDSLKFLSCDSQKCSLSFQYDVSGCRWDECFDLSCEGELSFDLHSIETEVADQVCTDL